MPKNSSIEEKESEEKPTKANTSTTTKRRRVDRGLDGGYWSRLSLDSGAAASAQSDAASTEAAAAASSRKRRRTATERLDLNMFSKPMFGTSPYLDDSSSVHESSDDGEMNTSIHSESTTGSKSISGSGAASKEHSNKDRFTLFKAKSFLAVLSDEGGFYLCQATHAIYEDSKRCKIQWLEEVGESRYKMGYVDWIDPATIVMRVKMRRTDDHLMRIDADDLKRVNELVDKALKEGGITVDFDKESGKHATAKKTNKNILNNEEFYDKEASDREEAKQPVTPKLNAKSSSSAPSSATAAHPEPKTSSNITSSSNKNVETAKIKPLKPSVPETSIKKPDSKEKISSSNGIEKTIKSSPNGEKVIKKPKPIEIDEIDGISYVFHFFSLKPKNLIKFLFLLQFSVFFDQLTIKL